MSADNNTHQGKVSVIVPTHNRANSLNQALLSINKQTYYNLEIIVIANGCVDNTDEIIKQFKRQFKGELLYLHFDKTIGGAKARNIGMDKAQGEYIAFLDDDDYWHKDKLATQIALLNKNQYAIIGSNFVYIHSKNQQKKAGRFHKNTLTIKDLYYENILGSFSFCLTKKAYLENIQINEALTALQDWDLWLKILHNTGLKAYISPAYHIYFRIDQDKISNQYLAVIKAQKIFLNQWKNQLNSNSIRYHKMRTKCLMQKTNSTSKYHYLFDFINIIKTIFNSPYRYHIKRYCHYLALPWVDIDKIRIKLWKN